MEIMAAFFIKPNVTPLPHRMKPMKKRWTSLWETVFPRTCPICQRQLLPDESGWCLLCDRDMPLTHFWDWRNNPAERRLWSRTPVHAACCLFYFDHSNPYPKLIYRIKYGGAQKLARLAGRRLGNYLLPYAQQNGWTGLVPVPLHWRKHWKRGYNQAEWIARGLGEVLGLPVYPHLLRRRRYTRTQTQIDPQNKWTNVANAFVLQHNHLPEGPQHLIIVDDVLTTGSTLAACATILVTQLGYKVSVATLAYVE